MILKTSPVNCQQCSGKIGIITNHKTFTAEQLASKLSNLVATTMKKNSWTCLATKPKKGREESPNMLYNLSVSVIQYHVSLSADRSLITTVEHKSL
jgi:hypothetical protein